MSAAVAASPTVLSSHRRARWTVAALGVAIGLAVLDLTSIVAQRSRPSGEWDGGGQPLTPEDLTADLGCALGLAILLNQLWCGFSWLLWQYRAYSNLHAVGLRRTEETPAWSLAYWFIPLANLVEPYRRIKELLLRSESGNLVERTRGAPAPALLRWWWASWLLSYLTSSAALVASLIAETPEASTAMTAVLVVDACLTAVGAWLAVQVVRRIQRAQDAWPGSGP